MSQCDHINPFLQVSEQRVPCFYARLLPGLRFATWLLMRHKIISEHATIFSHFSHLVHHKTWLLTWSLYFCVFVSSRLFVLLYFIGMDVHWCFSVCQMNAQWLSLCCLFIEEEVVSLGASLLNGDDNKNFELCLILASRWHQTAIRQSSKFVLSYCPMT